MEVRWAKDAGRGCEGGGGNGRVKGSRERSTVAEVI